MNPIPIRFFIHRIKTNRNPDKFSAGRVGAYCIRPTDGHARGRMKLIRIKFLIHRVKTNRNPVHFPVHLAICMTICGAYSIRPYTDTRKNDDSFIPRIKTNRNPDEFSSGRVGAYCIRPTDDHARGRMNPIPIRFLIHRIKTNQKSAGFFIPRVKRNPIPTGFSIPRPKTNLNSVGFFNPGLKGMAVPGA